MNTPSHEGSLEAIRTTLGAVEPGADLASLQYLASGEYTWNYRLNLDRGAGQIAAVLRVVSGSQMGLNARDQARYEAHALELLGSSGRTPRLLGVYTDTSTSSFPFLLIEYLPGRSLAYQTDLEAAAQSVAKVHRFNLPGDHRLQVHSDPVSSILDESDLLLAGLVGPEWAAVQRLQDRIASKPAAEFDVVRADLTVINTDLNSHNFIVGPENVWLIDWEKARIGPSFLDVAHAILPTTTLWRDASATRLTTGQQRRFVEAYLVHRPDLEPEIYWSGLRLARQLVALRAIAWCAWALGASQRGSRPIEHQETLEKARMYTSREFISDLSDELWGWNA